MDVEPDTVDVTPQYLQSIVERYDDDIFEREIKYINKEMIEAAREKKCENEWYESHYHHGGRRSISFSNRIKTYYEEKGFKASFIYDELYNDKDTKHIVGVLISWKK